MRRASVATGAALLYAVSGLRRPRMRMPPVHNAYRRSKAALKAKVRIIDISQLQSPDGGLRHDRLFSLAALHPQLERQPAAERQGFGAFLFDAANAKPIPVKQSPAN